MVEILLKLGADVNARSGRCCSALHAAIEDDNTKIAKVLLKAGADIEARFEDSNGTPLHYAAYRDTGSLAELLLLHGASVNSRSENHNDFHEAANNGLNDVVRKLIDLGADVNAVSGSYGTVLQASASNDEGHSETIALLLEKGADPNRHGGWCGTPLQLASASDSLRAVQILVSAGADIHYKGGPSRYHTALQAGCFSGAAQECPVSFELKS